MIVCVCRRVSDREIERLAGSGCASFDELQMESGVATCCGQCADCAQAVFSNAQARQQTVVLHAHAGTPAAALI
jgi:bacterioferritin-associated ferredoxin